MSIKQMTNRERIIAALHSKETDRLPWSPLVDPYFINSLPLQNIDLDIIGAMRYIGNDIMERHVAGPTESIANLDIREEINGDISRKYYTTPVGSIYEERKSSGQTHYVTKHLVESIDDVKVYQYMVEHTSYTPNIKDFIARDTFIGDSGIAVTSGHMSPVQNLLQFTSGVENTVYLMADYPDELDELFKTMQTRNLKYYQTLAEYPCEAVFDYEDTSTTVMSKNMFINYSKPAIDEYAKVIQASGKLFITHMCGKLTGFAEEIGKGIQDGIDSVCPPTTGDLYAWDARRIWGPSKIVIGGIEPPSLVIMSKEETLRCAIENMKKVENKLGFILSTGDAVPYATPIENLKIITELIETLGEKSLTGDFDENAIIKELLSK